MLGSRLQLQGQSAHPRPPRPSLTLTLWAPHRVAGKDQAPKHGCQFGEKVRLVRQRQLRDEQGCVGVGDAQARGDGEGSEEKGRGEHDRGKVTECGGAGATKLHERGQQTPYSPCLSARVKLYSLSLDLLQLHLRNHRVPHGAEPTLARWTTGPDLTSWLMVRRSNRRRKWLQVILLSLSPWPRPRLSSCISRRSKITSSWPGDRNSELQLAKPHVSAVTGFGSRLSTSGTQGKGQ